MADRTRKLPTKSGQAEVDAFLAKVAATPAVKETGARGRLIFAMDATASREPSWDRACHIQSEMFLETDALGGLDIQLCYYGGFREFHATPWLGNSVDLLAQMKNIRIDEAHGEPLAEPSIILRGLPHLHITFDKR